MSVQITASLVKELRDRTGVGMSKCKKALEEAGGDLDLAISNLRKAGMASAVKKEGRATKEGCVAFAENATGAAIIEINAETDFVIKNEAFQTFLQDMADEVLNTQPLDAEAFLQQKFSKDNSITIDEHRSLIIQTIGENIQVKRLFFHAKESNTSIGIYSHMGGKIVSLVSINGAEGEEALAKDLAMHIAAEAPEYLAAEDVPNDVKDNEKDIATTQAAGKPENIIDKIVEGKLKAYFDRVCLLRQKFIKDSDSTIASLLEKRGKEIGESLTVGSFLRWKVGSN